jgi:hypothetical protein
MKENINYGEARRQQILKGFTNIEECAEETPIEKARHGVYADNAQNRRLQRVGQEYGHAAQEKPEAEQDNGGGVPEANVSLQNHARQASEEALVKVANDPSADAEMRKVATAELERRGVSVRAKNKNGDTSLRNGLADGDAKSVSAFESMGFRQMDDEDLAQYAGVEDAAHAFIKQIGGDEDGFDLVVTKTSEGYRVDKYPYADVDNFETTTVKEIADVEEAASKFGDPDAKAKGGKADVASLIDSFNEMAEGNADFDAKSFKSFVKEKGGKAVKELADAIRKTPSEAGQSDLGDDEIADMIENMFDEAGTRVPREAKKELDNLRGSGESVLAKWDAYTSESGGDDDFGAALDRLIDNKGEAKTIKELAAAIKTSGQGEAAQSDILDDEIADEIANIFEEAGIDLSKKGQATLDKMRADSNGDGKVSSAESLVQSFDDMAENDTDFDTKGFKSFVKQKGDAAAIKELAAAMKANPADVSGAQSDATDDEIADTIANMFEMAGVKVSKDGQKELDALIGGEEESATKQGEKAKAEVKSAEKGAKAKTDKAAKSSPEKDNAAADKFIKKTDRGADPAEYAKMIAKNPEGIARALKARIASGDKEAQRAALSLNSLTDPQSRDQGVGQELLSHPELKKIADERQAARDSLRGVYDPEEYRKKVDAQLEVMKRTNKEFVDKFLEIYGGNTEE